MACRRKELHKIALENSKHQKRLNEIAHGQQDHNAQVNFEREKQRRVYRDKVSRRRKQQGKAWHPVMSTRSPWVGRGPNPGPHIMPLTSRVAHKLEVLPEAPHSGAVTARTAQEYNVKGHDGARKALSQINPAELTTLLYSKGLPDDVKRVGLALMVLVTPEDGGRAVEQMNSSSLDKCWSWLVDWVSELGGSHKWLSNLWHFNRSMMAFRNSGELLPRSRCLSVSQSFCSQGLPSVASASQFLRASACRVSHLLHLSLSFSELLHPGSPICCFCLSVSQSLCIHALSSYSTSISPITI